MAKTNLQRSAAYYERIVKEAEKGPFSESYKNICAALGKLINASKKLHVEDRKMTPQELVTITKSYENVRRAYQSYLAQKDNFSDFEKKRAGIIRDISTVLEKDLRVLKTCDPKKPMSLSEVMKKARSRKIVISEKDIQKVGGAQSSRLPISTTGGRKGFFTAAIHLDMNEKWKDKLAKYEERFLAVSKNCEKKLELLKTDEKFQLNISDYLPEVRIFEDDMYSKEANKRVGFLAYSLGMGENAAAVKALFKKNPGLYETVFEFMNSVVGLGNNQGIMMANGIKQGANISSRNCAMTDVAKMMGFGHLLANSEHMTIEIDGRQVEGVFMESADGTDLERLKDDDLIFEANMNSFENPDVLQQIVDLQALDFICGNTDRHLGNMMYQFKKTSIGQVQIVGIKGIDNDCSFGTPDVSKSKGLMKLTPPESMNYITKKMVEKLQSLDETFFRAKLAHNDLSPDEIDAAWKRVEMLRETVADGKKITIIDKNYWLKHPLFETKETDKDNYVARFRTVQTACIANEKPLATNVLKKKLESQKKMGVTAVNYAKETVTAVEIMTENDTAIHDLRAQMDNSKAKARIYDSSEFKSMRKRFETIEALTAKAKKYNDLKQVPDEISDALQKAYVELYERTNTYIGLKKLLPSSERGEKRLDLAKALKAFAEERLEKMGVNIDKEAEGKTPKADQREVDEPIEEIEVSP